MPPAATPDVDRSPRPRDPRLALIAACPDRVPMATGPDAPGRGLSERAGCLAGLGAVAGRVTLRDCLDCASGAGRGVPRRPFPGDVLIRAALTSWTGYGQIGEWLGRGLESLGLRVGYVDSGADPRYYPRAPWVAAREVLHRVEAPWTLMLDLPQVPHPGGRVARFTMWETSRVAAPAAEALNRAELVCVPCAANRRAFVDSGVTTPIAVVPMGVSPEEGYRDDGTPPPSGVCRFGMAGRMAHGGIRKGLNEGMEAFAAAFPRRLEDVELVVKVWEDCVPRLRVPADPRIRVVATPMRPLEMAAWYRTLTALLVPSKGEGWGLHTHQAMAVGRPVIAAAWGGTAEFWDDRFGWALDYDLAPAGEFYVGQGEWAVPRPDSMVERLRQVYADRGEAERKGRLAAGRAAEFTWERTALCLRQALVDSGMLGPEAGRGSAGLPGARSGPPPEVASRAGPRGATTPAPAAEIPIVVMTVERPEPYLEQTLASLAPCRAVTLMVGSPEVGYLGPRRDDPLIRVVAPSPAEYARFAGQGVWQRAAWNYWRCLGAAGGANRLLVFEDDVKFAVGWEERLARVMGRIGRDHDDYLLSLYYPYPGEEDGGAGFIAYAAEKFYGTQGMLFAGRALCGYREYLRERGVEAWTRPYDHLVRDYSVASGMPLLATMPSLVQHVGARTTGQSDHFHRAGSFEERVDDARSAGPPAARNPLSEGG